MEFSPTSDLTATLGSQSIGSVTVIVRKIDKSENHRSAADVEADQPGVRPIAEDTRSGRWPSMIQFSFPVAAWPLRDPATAAGTTDASIGSA